MSQEKGDLPYGTIVNSRNQADVPSGCENTRARPHRRILLVTLTIAVILSLISKSVFVWRQFPFDSAPVNSQVGKAKCAQVDPLFPSQKSDKLHDMEKLLSSDEFEKASIKRLSGAVQIPTQSYDDMGEIGEDKRWDVMYDFESYLRKIFPSTFSKLSVELVNTHGIVITWNGTDSELKPTLLMAHQDVVPVADSTVGAWTHPPFSGFYDGKYIWGRGSNDCKNQLIGIMEAVELLLAADYVPKRTLVLSFGFDEEIKGGEGAAKLAPFLIDRYGKDGVAAIVDEGSAIGYNWGQATAVPGVGEKGYIDVEITIRMPGGHSSIPSPHTSIGVVSELVTLIEAHPYDPYLANNNPYLSILYCGAEHSPEFPNSLRKALKKADKQPVCKKSKDHLAHEAAKAGPAVRYLFQTSQAADIINGGVKNNALPERTTVLVNHRVNIGESYKDVQEKLTNLAKGIANKHNLTLHAFDGVEEPSSIILSSGDAVLEPAPVTPTEVDKVTPYSILSGTVRALYGTNITVAPGLMTGNTDTK